MGYSVLYVAFGIVALWLLGEVLLQYKARLRWRVLAFAGFLGVVIGVYLRDVVVIVLGAAAFGTGQTFVTLSYKRGFSTGWALGGRPGSSRRRKGATPRSAPPVLEVSPVEEPAAADAAVPAGHDVLSAEGGDPAQVYQPVPMHDDSGEYPLYDGSSSYTPDPYTSGGYEGYGAQGYAGWEAEPQPAAASAGYDAGTGYTSDGYGYGYTGQGYDQGTPYQGYEQQPAAASWDSGSYGSYGSYGGYDPYAPQTADPYAGYGHDPNTVGEPAAVPPQPYIPPQQHQPPYEPQGQPYADPYDPYRY